MSSTGSMKSVARRSQKRVGTEDSHDYLFKVLLLGDAAVGKTSLINRFADDSFNPGCAPTIVPEFKNRTVKVGDKVAKLQLWDTAGQERYRSLTRAHYRGAVGAVIAYDITSSASYDNLAYWIQQIKEQSSRPENMTVLLVGNKCDLQAERQVEEATAQAFAKSVEYPLMETSAQASTNVEQAFNLMAAELLKRNSKAAPADRADGKVSKPEPAGTKVDVKEKEKEEPKKKAGCCG